jgi:hypothetical protein
MYFMPLEPLTRIPACKLARDVITAGITVAYQQYQS